MRWPPVCRCWSPTRRTAPSRAFASGPEFRFRPGDVDDLAAQIDSLLDNPTTLAIGARRSLERAAQHDFQRSARSLENLYEMVLAKAVPERRALPPRRGVNAPGCYAVRLLRC